MKVNFEVLKVEDNAVQGRFNLADSTGLIIFQTTAQTLWPRDRLQLVGVELAFRGEAERMVRERRRMHIITGMSLIANFLLTLLCLFLLGAMA